MVSKLIRLVAPLVFVVACSKDDPPPDRTRANGPGAPVEQPATKDPTVQPAEQPTLTNGVRGTQVVPPQPAAGTTKP